MLALAKRWLACLIIVPAFLDRFWSGWSSELSNELISKRLCWRLFGLWRHSLR